MDNTFLNLILQFCRKIKIALLLKYYFFFTSFGACKRYSVDFLNFFQIKKKNIYYSFICQYNKLCTYQLYDWHRESYANICTHSNKLQQNVCNQRITFYQNNKYQQLSKNYIHKMPILIFI